MKKQLETLRDKLQAVVDRAEALAASEVEATGDKYDAVAQNLYNAIEAIDDAITILAEGV